MNPGPAWLSGLLLAMFALFALEIAIDHPTAKHSTQLAFGSCIMDEDWPQRECLDMPPYTEEYLDQYWQGYYDYKGAQWMEMKKAEMDEAIANGTLRQWIETRVSPNNFANSNVWHYYNRIGQAPDLIAEPTINVIFQLEIGDISIFDHKSTTLVDYHPEQQPINHINAGQEFVVNAPVRNVNYLPEHFDYITEVLDNEGRTVYLHIRNGVAVNLDGFIPIDSSTSLIILERGTYSVKIFAWSNVDDLPFALSQPSVGIISVS